MNGSNSSEEASLGKKAKIVPCPDFNFFPLSDAATRQPTEVSEEPKKRTEWKDPSVKSTSDQKTRKRGRETAEQTDILKHFIKKEGKPEVRWGPLREKLFNEIANITKCVLDKSESPGMFKYDPKKEDLWTAEITALIQANESYFESICAPKYFRNLTDQTCSQLFANDEFKKLHALCMRVLFGEEEVIPPARIDEISVQLNVDCYENEYWQRLKEYLTEGMVQAVSPNLPARADSMIASPKVP